MKRKSCLIEEIKAKKGKHGVVTVDTALENLEERAKAITIEEKMFKNTVWYKSLLNAEKSCLKDDKIKKIHYKFEDGREMVEEYNVDTQVMLRRTWKVQGKLGGEGKWDVEVGDAIPDATRNMEMADIAESKDQPMITRRNTRVNLEWRIRNLPYPIETYSIVANKEEQCIIVRTTNKKYFKKLQVPELLRLNLPLEQANVQSSHKFHTLVIMYKKPPQLLEMEKEWFEELNKIKPIQDVPNDCKAQ